MEINEGRSLVSFEKVLEYERPTTNSLIFHVILLSKSNFHSYITSSNFLSASSAVSFASFNWDSRLSSLSSSAMLRDSWTLRKLV